MTDRTPAPKPLRVAPKFDLTTVEWKLGLGTVLASVFTAAWFAVLQPAATAPVTPEFTEVVASNPPPANARRTTPAVTTTAVPRARAAPARTATVAVAPQPRSFRVRTRSS